MAKVGKKKEVRTITFDRLKLSQGILEVRYAKGYLYWDVCGKCILEINKRAGGKIDFLELRGDKCILRFLENPTANASFGIKQMTVSGTNLRNVNLFKENGPLILDIIRTNLKIEELTRVGFRLFYVLEKESIEEAEAFVNGLDLFALSSGKFKGFGKELCVSEPRILISDGKEKARVCVSAAKRTDAEEEGAEFDEYRPRYAVLTDIDFYTERLNAADFNLEDFIHRCHKKTRDHIGNILNR